MNIGEMQRKLSLWAAETEEPEEPDLFQTQRQDRRLFDLYHLLYDQEWLGLAHDHVARNAGSETAGCDGLSMRNFDENLEVNLQKLAEDLKAQTFAPHPVRRVYIPKKNGKLRPLGIPSIRDRIVQEALRMVFEPIFEALFSQNSFGFRPTRCTMDAVQYLVERIKENTRYFWAIEGDISSYFDTIKHRKLMKLLAGRIRDEKLLRLVWKFLKAGVMEGKLFKDTTSGAPQGGIVSPLLANVYLHELDRFVERWTGLPTYRREKRRRQGLPNFVYARYADDFVVLCNGTKDQATAFRDKLHSFLQEELALNLSMEKTKVTHVKDGFQFLGFEIKRCMGQRGEATKLLIPAQARDRFRHAILKATAPTTCAESLNFKILTLNRIIRGWCQYYQYTTRASAEFNRLNTLVFWRMAHWLGRKFKLSMPEVMRRYRRGSTFTSDDYQLLVPKAFGRKVYPSLVHKPNPYTTAQRLLTREDLPPGYTILYESRPGWADLRLLVLKRDNFTCGICKCPVTAETAEVDHLRPYGQFRRPIDANHLDNLWTLCVPCHQRKTELDRQMESRMR